jgi:acyl carrier protein
MKADSNHIEDKLAAYIRENCLPKNNSQQLDYNKNLFDAGIVDSAGLVTYICFIEVEFNIKIPEYDLLPENFATVNTIANYIRRQKVAANECV